MLPFTSREEYDKWKAERSKKLSQSSEDEFSTRCFECGKEVVDANNFCPHCGISLRNQNNESGGALQNDKIYRNVLLRIKKEFSPGLIYYRVKRLIRATIICLIAYSVVSLFYGGKPFRKLNEKIYDVFTYAAEKSQNNSHESLSAILVSSREDICSFVDYLACQSDQLGVVDQYISSKKIEREKEGEQIADDLKMNKKLQEEESEQR
jgi:zinc ribbon protein